MNHDHAARPTITLIFGGSFDPPHRAHVALPRIVAKTLGADQILYIPAAVSPLKRDTQPTDAVHRLAMLRLALESTPNTTISTLELNRPGPSFTIDTLRELHQTAGAHEAFRLLIGADQALVFHRWREWQHIIELAEPVVMLRAPFDRDRFRSALTEQFTPEEVDAWMRRTIEVPRIDISSTDIRQRLSRGESVSDALNPAVEEYIRRHALYGSGTHPAAS